MLAGKLVALACPVADRLVCHQGFRNRDGRLIDRSTPERGMEASCLQVQRCGSSVALPAQLFPY